ILRHTAYQAIREGKLLPRKQKTEKLEGMYDPASQVLNETTTGRIYRFDPSAGTLSLKQAIYRKLK
ncbi:MAG: hypothetical protein JST32_15525, partial [Bacteroidetes bacterium]|nr:hypothetical protein [Bacteroidota bacterium]